MGRRFLVIFGRSDIRKKGERIRVSSLSSSTEVPVRYIEAVICVGSASVSAEAVNLLLSRNIPLYLMSRFGTPRGALLPHTLSSRNGVRLTQYRAFQNKRLSVARSIITDKARATEKLFRMDLSGLMQKIGRAQSINELMGVEGEISRRMFERFRENIKNSSFSFEQRDYRPPPDPVNALLSLSYTFTYFLTLPVVLFMGYDPFISFLHAKRGSHASFCSDVIEPVRPLITKRLEELIVLGHFSDEDFLRSGKGCYLRKESYPKFVSWIEGVKEELIEEIRASLLRLYESMK